MKYIARLQDINLFFIFIIMASLFSLEVEMKPDSKSHTQKSSLINQ